MHLPEPGAVVLDAKLAYESERVGKRASTRQQFTKREVHVFVDIGPSATGNAHRGADVVEVVVRRAAAGVDVTCQTDSVGVVGRHGAAAVQRGDHRARPGWCDHEPRDHPAHRL